MTTLTAHSLGATIAMIRKTRGLTQPELAESAGLSQSYISALERGERTNLTLDTLSQIAEALGATLEVRLTVPADEAAPAA